ncbi:MAG TPA: AraC family transcriptional regulator ligand-binding domain-containing protein, partial [Gemmataceae bacterium]|nr:AraC family transcriptional regulator ligand-binding domain-containing protein [Gemmataceae bacterium]
MRFRTSSATPRRAMTPAAFAQGVVAAYARYGRDPGHALIRAQVPADILNAPDARITASQFETLAGHAMRELDDEALGWFSRRLPWGTYGMLCRASIAAPSLEV